MSGAVAVCFGDVERELFAFTLLIIFVVIMGQHFALGDSMLVSDGGVSSSVPVDAL